MAYKSPDLYNMDLSPLLRMAGKGYPQRYPQGVDEMPQSDEYPLNDQILTKDGFSPLQIPEQQPVPTQAEINAVSNAEGAAVNNAERDIDSLRSKPTPSLQQGGLERLIAANEARQAPEIEKQKAKAAEMEALRKAANSNSFENLNLAPLLSLYAPGSEKGYVSPDERNKAKQEALTRDIAAQDVVLKELQKSGGDIKDILQLQNMEDRQKRYDRSLGYKGGGDLFTKFSSDQDVKKAKETNLASQEALKILRSGSKIGDQAVRIKLARAMGAAPISDTDIRNLSGSPAVADVFMRVYEKLMSGKMTEADRADAIKLLDSMNELSNSVYAQRMDYYINNVAPNAYGVDPERAKLILGSGISMVSGGQKKESSDTQTKPSEVKQQKSQAVTKAKPQTVIQNGHTYTFNPSTNSYE